MSQTLQWMAVPAFAAFFSCFLAAPMDAAAISFNNLAAATAGTDSIASVGPLGDSFSTAEYGTTLNQVSLRLLADIPSDGASFGVQLLSNASNHPGAVLATIGNFPDSSLTTTLGSYTLTLATPYNLAANTRYWIELISSGSSAEWAWSYNLSGPGVMSQYLSNSYGTFANSGNAPYQMQVVTASPEPSSLAIVGIGLAGVMGAITRRKLPLYAAASVVITPSKNSPRRLRRYF